MILKRIINYILIFIILFCSLAVPNISSANSNYDVCYTDVEKVVHHLYTLCLNNAYHKNKSCLNFVTHTWSTQLPHIKGWYSGCCCATDAKNKFMISTKSNKYDYPLGASIFFKGSTADVDCKHRDPGHVGIHVGDGYIVHCYSKGKIMKHHIDEIVDHGYTYLGWGYPSGKKLEPKPDKSPEVIVPVKPVKLLPEQKKNSKLSIHFERLPQTIQQSNSFGLYGKIESNFPIISITGSFYSHSLGETLLSYTDAKINTKSLDISTSNLNKKLKFGDLPPGEYTLMIVAEDITTNTKSLTHCFTVQAPESSLSINLTSKLDKTNNIHTEGNRLGLYGTITSNYNIKSVSGVVQRITSRNSNGTICVDQILDTAFNCNTKTKKININKSNLNYDLTFADLKPGDYVLQIRATDSSDNSVNLVKNFKVVANQGIVTGTVVNLDKLGWKTVSIRKGASTNYKIIGDMTTGTKCKVDLDKSTTNWYYIEYNGIKGYASKKGISI